MPKACCVQAMNKEHFEVIVIVGNLETLNALLSIHNK